MHSLTRPWVASVLWLLAACAPSSVQQTLRAAPLAYEQPRGPSLIDASQPAARDAAVAVADASADAAMNSGVDVTVAPPTLADALARYELDSERPWRQVVYSWTPRARAQILAADRVLLVAKASSGNYQSPFSRLLLRLRSRSDLVGTTARTLLSDPAMSRYRYAWASSFPTARGFQGRSYGTALVRVSLRPDALWLVLDPTDARVFWLVDSENRQIPIERFAAVQQRVAGVFHRRGRPEVIHAFREYILCNNAAVASWEVGTATVMADMDAEAVVVDRAIAALAAAPSLRAPSGAVTEHAWRFESGESLRLYQRWMRTMATAAPHYAFRHENLLWVADALSKRDRSVVIAP
ncbi:MAG: hypothetical protein Q8Q09_11285 [Deltaproteobacteria bacterium]|nr:hypothetical protein [Deltaproteobacteria bacterium]